jgi:lysophospholipase L1-like esterase
LVAATPALPSALTSASPRILVLGDSVTWGQGLLPNQKMHRLLAKMLFDRNGIEPEILHYAHSGAVVGFVNGAQMPPGPSQPWWPREIPNPYPTVREQLDQVALDHPDWRYDAIVVAAGINDVDVRKIFNPTTSTATIANLCARYCDGAMQLLLDAIQQRFVAANPSVKVIVLGYYPVLSDASDIPSVASVAEALVRETISPPHPSANLQAYTYTFSLRDILVRNSLAFRDASLSNLQSAVAAANAKWGANNFQFVDPHIADAEAAFTQSPLIWGLTKNLDDAEDPVLNDRIEYCNYLLQKKPGPDQFTCLRASLGHPNVSGAERYAQQLYPVLTA